jgi:flagellar hook-associated protein 2
MGLSPLTFSGVSSLSSELQTVLNRAVSIASIPLKRLQNEDADVLQKKTLLGALSDPLASLGSAVTALGRIASNNAISATSSDATTVSVVNTGSSSSAVYSITQIASIATAATETSVLSYASSDPVSSNGAMRLTVGAETYNFTLTTNTLAGLRDKINALGAGVTASILTTDSGNYLSVSANGTGAKALALRDDPDGANIAVLTANNQGSDADFYLNGIHITRSSNAVNDIVGGLTFTILGETEVGQTVKLTLATDRSQLSSAISTFVAKYNAVVAQVGQQVGPNAGLLSGDFLIREVQKDLRALSGYQASGTVKNLSDMGITFDLAGKISFDTDTFDALSDDQISGVFDFFGSTSTGFGALSKKFTQLTDPITGLIKIQQDSYDTADRRLQQRIEDLTERIGEMQKSVAARLQLADALLAQLESQKRTISASIEGMNLVLFGKKQD